MAEEKPAEWDQAWPATKIRQQAADWNLAGDAGLLLYLRQTSSDFMSRLENTKKNMANVSEETQKTIVRLESTVNDFSRLANSQFIENRVYDDDTKPNRDSKPKQEVTKTKEEREAEVISVMKSALETGCAILDTHFTKIDMRSLDFDEDDDPSFSPQPIFEPKDPYTNRPLPYIIATANFMKSESVGLREEEEEIEANKKEELSESDEETTSPAATSVSASCQPAVQTSPVVSAAKSIAGAISPSPVENAASDSSSSGLFGTSADSGDHAFPKAVSQKTDDHEADAQGPRNLENDFRSELTRKLIGDTSASSTTKQEKPKSTPRPSATAASSVPDDDLLFSPPPLLPRQQQQDSDDEGGLFKPRSRGLFDDDEDEESQPPPAPRGRLQQLANTGKTSSDSKPAPAITRDSSRSSTSVASTTPTVQSSAAASTSRMFEPSVAPKAKSTSMFVDDEDDDEDDLFGKAYKKETSRNILSASTKSPVEDTAKKPAAAVTRPVQPSVITGASLFGDDEDDDDLFAVLKRPKPQSSSKSTGLFGEGHAEKPLVKTDSKPTAPTIPAMVHAQTEHTDGPETSKPVTIQTDISKPEIEPAASDGLFSRSLSPPPKQAASSSTKESAPSQIAKSRGLFEDDSDDDSLFPSTATGLESEPTNAKEEKVAKKNDFRAELSKKLLMGPQASGLLKSTTKYANDDGSFQSSDQVLPPSEPTPAGKPNQAEDDDDLFSPPAHGLFGNDSIDKVLDVDKGLDVDSVTNVETLPSLQKSRAKLPNRRPPTKHASSAVVGQNGFETPDVKSSGVPSAREENPVAKAVDDQNSIQATDPLGAGAATASPPELLPLRKEVEIPKVEKIKPEEKLAPKVKTAVLFDDDDDEDLFGKVVKKASTSRSAFEQKLQEKKQSVAPASSSTAEVAVKKAAVRTGGGLFSDEDDDDLFSDTKKTVINKSMQSSVDADADIFVTKPKSAIQPKAVTTSALSHDKKKGKSLFDDDDEDDIFR